MIAELLALELKSKNIEIANYNDVDVISIIIQYLGTIHDCTLNDDFYFGYIKANYANVLFNQTDSIINWLRNLEIIDADEIQSNFLAKYDAYYASDLHIKAKSLDLVDSFCDYYVQKSIIESKFNSTNIFMCILFVTSNITDEDFKALLDIALKFGDELKRNIGLFEEGYNAYAINMLMPFAELDISCINELIKGEMIGGYGAKAQDDFIEYDFCVKTKLSFQNLREKLQLQYSDAVVTLKTLYKQTIISRQIFEDAITNLYQRIRNFNVTIEPDYKWVTADTKKAIKESIDYVYYTFRTKSENIIESQISAESMSEEEYADLLELTLEDRYNIAKKENSMYEPSNCAIPFEEIL